MQYDRHYEGLTDHYHAMVVAQPLADEMARGEKDHIVRPRPTPYRGEFLIVSTPKGDRGGMIVGRANLDSVEEVKGGFLYRLSKMERMIEFPCQKCGARGEIWDCYYTKNTLTPYPKINLRRVLNGNL